MTREEALNKAIGVLTYHQVNFCKSKEAVANMNEIIDALEKIDQECVADKDIKVTATDCIRRQDVEDAIYDYSRSCDVNYAQIMEFIDKLPSVTPQPKMGRWIPNRCDMYICSKCSHTYTDLSGERYGMNFCPFCGCKMQEVEE